MTEHLEPVGSALSLDRPRWGRAIVAVLVAGIVPAVLINLFVLYGLNRTAAQLFDFLLHLLPLLLGAWAAAGQDRRPRLLAILGILAGGVEVLVMVVIFSSAGHEFLAFLFDGYHTVPSFEDYVAVPATAALFIWGALIADRRKGQPPERAVALGT